MTCCAAYAAIWQASERDVPLGMYKKGPLTGVGYRIRMNTSTKLQKNKLKVKHKTRLHHKNNF